MAKEIRIVRSPVPLSDVKAMAQPDWIEFDSMINIRPAQHNRSRGVEDERIRSRIVEIVSRLIET